MNLILLEQSDFISAGRVTLTGRRHTHIAKVLRATPGQVLQVGLLQGLIGTGRVVSIDETSVILETSFEIEPPEPHPVRLVLALPRPKAFKRILQGVCAIGVKQVHLVNTWRVEKSYWQSPLLQGDKLTEQLKLGLEQARDTRLPEIEQHPLFKPFVEDTLPGLIKGHDALIAHPGANTPCPSAVERPTFLAIGPEGGFIPYEVDALQKAGFTPVSLGARALRVETAVPALLGRLAPAR